MRWKNTVCNRTDDGKRNVREIDKNRRPPSFMKRATSRGINTRLFSNAEDGLINW